MVGPSLVSSFRVIKYADNTNELFIFSIEPCCSQNAFTEFTEFDSYDSPVQGQTRIKIAFNLSSREVRLIK